VPSAPLAARASAARALSPGASVVARINPPTRRAKAEYLNFHFGSCR
jgi:hypothetical protein